MSNSKSYTIDDLFYTAWDQLSCRTHAEVYALVKSLSNPSEKEQELYGFKLIRILQLLRKDVNLVSNIDEAQAVDIFNNLFFLNIPWYSFTKVGKVKCSGFSLRCPDDHLATSTFNHFIYADHEWTSYIATQDPKHLTRLVATLWQTDFDEEKVEAISANLNLKEWQLTFVFFTYAHVREFVMKRCKNLLPVASKSEDDIPAKPRSSGAMWKKLKHRLSETPAFAGMINAENARMYKALDYLEDLAQQRANAKS